MKEKLKKILPKRIIKRYNLIHYRLQTYIKNPTNKYALLYHIKSGNKSDVKFCVYRYSIDTQGIMQVVRRVLIDTREAEMKGLIPVIDFEFENTYKDNRLNADNYWQVCFEQPIGYSIEEAIKVKNTIVTDLNCNTSRVNVLPVVHSKDNNYYRQFAEGVRKYIHLNNKMHNRILIERKRLGFGSKKILGISVREEFKYLHIYSKDMSEKHPKEPEYLELVAKANELKNIWDFNFVFIAAEHEETIKLFKSYFGESLLYTNRKRLKIVNGVDELIARSENVREGTFDPKLGLECKMEDYVEEVYLLAECDYLLGTKNGATLGSLLLNSGKYKDNYIWFDDNCSKYY